MPDAPHPQDSPGPEPERDSQDHDQLQELEQEQDQEQIPQDLYHRQPPDVPQPDVPQVFTRQTDSVVSSEQFPTSSASSAIDINPRKGKSNVTATSGALLLNTLEASATLSHVDDTISVVNQEPSRPSPVLNGSSRLSMAPSIIPTRGILPPDKLTPHTHHTIPLAINRNPRAQPISHYRFEDDNVSTMSTSSLATSFSKSFLFGFLNNKQKDGKGSGLLSKEYWMKDETSTECFICGRLFTTFRRKHHCRICGQIFCSACTTLISGEKFNHSGKMRVCKTCISFANDYNDSSDESSIMDESYVDRIQNQDIIATNSNTDGQSLLPNTPGNDDKPFLTAPTPPPRLAIPATRKGESVEIPVSRSFNSKAPSSSLHTTNFGRRKTLDRSNQHPGFYRADEGNSSNVNFNFNFNSGVNISNLAIQEPSTFADYVKSHRFSGAFNFNAEINAEEPETTHSELKALEPPYSDSEDEISMSIYAALHLDRSDVPDSSNIENKTTRVTRSNTRSMDRAQASLYRMRNRRKSKSASRPQFGLAYSSSHLPDSGHSLVNNEYSWNSVDSQHDGAHSRPFKTELNDVCNIHFENLLTQDLQDEEVPNVDEWSKTLSSVLQQVQTIEYNVKAGDNMDIRQYVKLKRLEGAKPSDTDLVNGVIFSKTFALKSMPKQISNPRIALIMFPLEYMKAGQHFMSLEPVINQEKEFIHKLVARILALNPDVILVGASVSGLALKLLNEANVAVAYNVKPQVIERVARLTQADIVISMDKLALNLKLGSCDSMTVKTFAYKNITKTLIFLAGCDNRLGCTILLRGGDEELLRKIKETSEFMVYSMCNLQLETSFYRDSFVYLPQEFYNSMRQGVGDEASGVFGDDFLQLFRKRILSVSPTVEFDPPYLLMKTREIANKLNSAKIDEENLDDQGVIDSTLGNTKSFLEEEQISLDEINRIVQWLLKKKVETLDESFHVRKRQWDLFSSFSPEMLDPQKHQNITFLYSMVSSKNATPCVGPHPLNIDYYWDNDMTLGQYVDHLISSSGSFCSEGCGETHMNHYRTYVHGNAKVDIMLEPFTTRTPIPQNVLLMWSYCKQCGHTSPFLPMSETSWKFSFGKFLELLFWSKKHSTTNLGNCSHDFAKDHIKYFTYNDLTVRMEYSTVDLLELITPRPKLSWKPETNVKLKIELRSQIIEKSERFFNSVMARLNRVKVDSISNDKMEAGQKRIEQLKQGAADEQADVKNKIEEIYNSTDPGDHLKLNSVLRFVLDLSVGWDSEFANFEADYLPSEKDIARITAQQLKKFFLDSTDEKRDEPEISSPPGSSIMSKEKAPEALNVPEIQENKASAVSELLQDSENADDKKFSPKQGKVLEEINRFEKLFIQNEVESKPNELKTKPLNVMPPTLTKSRQSSGGEQSQTPKSRGIERSMSTSGPLEGLHKTRPRFGISASDLELQLKEGRQKSFGAASLSRPEPLREDSKVSKLTSYFDQIHFETLSKEFELQREKERRMLIQNRYKAVPVSSSRPIVEIYKNVKDAVDEDDTEGIAEDKISTQTAHSPLINGVNPELGPGFKEDALKNEIPQTERVSLMKTLANFWADRSATLWKPLEYPLSSAEHIFADSDVIVRDDEPSSLIAFCLSSSDYSQKIDRSEDLESVMLKKTAVHLKYQFQDGDTQLACKIFFAEQFDAFRRTCGLEDNFIQSLSRCVKWDSSGGKSGSVFLKTLDDRLVIKELSGSELDSFVKFAPSYFEYMAQALFHDLPTAIAKIFGFYQLYMKNPHTGKVFKANVLIMENLFFERKNLRIFDLKGSMRNRHVQKTGKENEVLLDENMVEYIYESPLFVREYDKKLLRASLWNDTLFLAKMNVMDYSLVIGIDDENKTLTVGIIDCIRTFTWDKKLESWVKEKGLVGGSTKLAPTIVTPRQYKNRFREAMDRYILIVPDCWYQGNAQS